MPKKLKNKVKFSGRVVIGEKVGQKIGFPTANLSKTPSEEELQLGVYAGRCHLPNTDETYPCLVYFGPRSIFGEKKNSFEVFLYNFDRDIYGWELEVELESYLREPIKFESKEKLKAQLTRDEEKGKQLL